MKLCSGSGRKVKRLNHAPGFSCRGKFQALHVLKKPLENSRFCLRKLRRGGKPAGGNVKGKTGFSQES